MYSRHAGMPATNKIGSIRQFWFWTIWYNVHIKGNVWLAEIQKMDINSQGRQKHLTFRFITTHFFNWIVSIPCSWIEAFQPLCPQHADVAFNLELFQQQKNRFLLKLAQIVFVGFKKACIWHCAQMGLADVAFAIKLGENWSQMGNAIGLAASEQTFFFHK